ncbi:TPA: glycosyltransferase family 4 protein [Vibrio alginolyticus]|nr:glycosyltransferase family 4 protein [Vibrio alginolyticus]
MLYYDGIIEDLQKYGGITVVFKEIISRLPKDLEFTYAINEELNSKISPKNQLKVRNRILERYRDCLIKGPTPDLFHSTYYRLPNKSVPTVTTVHDFTYEYYSSGLKKYVHQQQKYSAIKGSDSIICVSQNTANDLIKFCRVNEAKIEVVYNGVSENFKYLENAKRKRHAVFVGSRASYKNFTLSVEAVALTKDISLAIVGGGELNTAEKALLETKLNGRYKKYSFLEEEDLNVLYNEAVCFLYPSLYEGFGIPILESMRAGCPVITVNSSSIPEVAGTSSLMIDSNDLSQHSLKEAIDFLDTTDRNRTNLVNSGFIQASKFSWHRCASEISSIYRKYI